MFRFCHLVSLIIGIAAVTVPSGSWLAHAAKPGGSGGGTVPAGRIYFFDTDIGVMTSRQADGKNSLPEYEWEPSRQLHNDDQAAPRRWFLDVRETPELGFYPPQGIEGAVWPRQEVFAVRDDGLAIRLTNDPQVQPVPGGSGHLRWAHDDSFISFIGVRWEPDSTTRGVICLAAITFIDGMPMLVEAPTVWMDSGTNQDGGWTYPDLSGHDWSPLGNQLVFTEVVGGDIWTAGGVFPEVYVTTFGEGAEPTTNLRAYGKYPEWSAQGRIAYLRFDTVKGLDAGIRTMNGDGSGAVQMTSGQDRFVTWSPDGTQLAFARTTSTNKKGTRTYAYDVMRVPAVGGTAVNLTADFDGGQLIVAGWRSN